MVSLQEFQEKNLNDS